MRLEAFPLTIAEALFIGHQTKSHFAEFHFYVLTASRLLRYPQSLRNTLCSRIGMIRFAADRGQLRCSLHHRTPYDAYNSGVPYKTQT